MKRKGIFLSIIFILCGIGYAGHIYWGYLSGRIEYESLNRSYVSDYDSSLDESIAEDDSLSGNYNYLGKPNNIQAPIPKDAPGRIKINWTDLNEKNPDIVGWLQIPSVKISYPIMQAEDNDYYLHRGMNKEYLFAGSVFMDADCQGNMRDYHTIIYGHNMRDGSMFAGLKEFQKPKTLENGKYFWIYTPSSDFLYEIFSVHTAAVGSDTYILRFKDYEAHHTWIEDMIAASNPKTDCIPEVTDRIVTLSTCTGSPTTRMTVQGKLVWKTER